MTLWWKEKIWEVVHSQKLAHYIKQESLKGEQTATNEDQISSPDKLLLFGWIKPLKEVMRVFVWANAHLVQISLLNNSEIATTPLHNKFTYSATYTFQLQTHSNPFPDMRLLLSLATVSPSHAPLIN